MRFRRSLGTLCIICGAVLICGALSLFVYNLWDNLRAGRYSDAILSDIEDADSSDLTASEDDGMTQISLDGELYIGLISIPSLSIELPVAGEWSYAQLRNSPCRYTGSVYTYDLVICAHNYARHFGTIKNLTYGDIVYFIDLDGYVWSYEVAEMDILNPTAVEEMTAGNYDLTLFTCTYGGKTRVTVRCNLSDG